MSSGETYVAAIAPADCFVDQSYQRVLDVARARCITSGWDRRLVGLIEVSDRGPEASPRYAVIDGQHRWAAARFLADPPQLVANVHEGLTIAQEAELFDKLNRQRRQPTTWDHWKARRSAGDLMVAAIERVVREVGLGVTENTTSDLGISCTSTLERVASSAGGLELLHQTLDVITAAWPGRRSGVDAPMVLGVAIVLDNFDDRVNKQRLVQTLTEMPPKRIKLAASTLRDAMHGTLGKLTAMAIINEYNHTPGSKLALPNRWAGSLAKPKATAQAKPALPQRTPIVETVRTGIDIGQQVAAAVAPSAPVARIPSGCLIPANAAKELGVGSEFLKQLNDNPPSGDDELIDGVRATYELPISAAADELGISISEVRRIRAQIASQ